MGPQDQGADPREGVLDRFRALPLVHRLVPLAHGLLLVALVAPWFQGRPFRISSEASAGTTVVYGVQVGLGPVVAFLVAVSLGGLLLSRSRGLREGALVVTFVTAGAWVAAFYLVGADLACFLCSDRKILWGPIVAALGASLGLLLTLFGVDWEVALAGLREELGR